MNKKDKKILSEKIKTSLLIEQRGQKSLCSAYLFFSAYYGEFLFVKRGLGSKIWDVDNNEFLDCCMGLGVLLLGHAHPAVVEAGCQAIRQGAMHGLGAESEIRLAELMIEANPWAQYAVFVNSGTEATMHALKIARAVTGKYKVAKFEGCYHGTHDYAQISGRFSAAGPVETPLSIPEPGVPPFVVENVITLSYNEPASLELIRKHKNELAAVIVEPIPLCCPLDFSRFLQELRQVTQECGVFLIFDEVLTGFRFLYGGVGQQFNIVPDLATFGKIIGGGLPVGAIIGPEKYMRLLRPGAPTNGEVFIIGTFSGNPATCSSGVAMLEYLRSHQEIYAQIENKAARVKVEVEAYAKKVGFPLQLLGKGPILVPFFTTNEIRKPRDTNWKANFSQYQLLRRQTLKYNVCLPDNGSIFLSAAHTDEDCTQLITALQKSLQELY